MDKDLRIAALEGRVAHLEGQVALLQEGLFAGYVPPIEWMLTWAEARVMGVLVSRDFATRQMMMVALYHDEHRDAAEPRIVDVFICKLRKKVRAHGVEIQTVFGQGWRLRDRHAYQVAA